MKTFKEFLTEKKYATVHIDYGKGSQPVAIFENPTLQDIEAIKAGGGAKMGEYRYLAIPNDAERKCKFFLWDAELSIHAFVLEKLKGLGDKELSSLITDIDKKNINHVLCGIVKVEGGELKFKKDINFEKFIDRLKKGGNVDRNLIPLPFTSLDEIKEGLPALQWRYRFISNFISDFSEKGPFATVKKLLDKRKF
jgi:hypothetical protein